MNADELMDARLREAGERWRGQQAESAGATPTVPVQDLAPKRPAHRARFAWLATAAAIVVVAVGAGVLIANQGSSPGPAPVEAGRTGLHDRTWQLQRITGATGRTVTVAGNPSLRIDGNNLSGTDGCNHLSGTVRFVQGSKLVIGSLATTEMACADADVIATAAAVDRILTGTLQWQLDGGTLTLTGRNGTLTYSAQPAPTSSTDPKDLLGSWSLTTIEQNTGPNGVASSAKGSTITFTQGRIRIAHDCYVNSGNVMARAGTLVISGVTLAEAIPCPSSAGSPDDQRVDAVLDGTLTWRIESITLAITKGTTTLQFDRIPDPARSSSSP